LPNSSYLFPKENEDGILKELLEYEKRTQNNMETFFPVYRVVE
jgi:hypothetical protein